MVELRANTNQISDGSDFQILLPDGHTSQRYLTTDGDLCAQAAAEASITAPLSLGNLVFADNNMNGFFDAGDAGIDGVTVELWNAGDDPNAGRCTAGDGGHCWWWIV